MDQKNYTIGLDYGSDSVRAVIVDAADGTEISSSTFAYPRWKAGEYCDPTRNRFRQHPLDYLEGLEATVTEALSRAPKGSADRVVAISIDTTGSTPVAVDRVGTPLALTPEFEDNPNAMFVLWKDHTAVREADEINRLARSWGGVDYTQYEGGIYSSEWFWAKVLHVAREDSAVADAAWSWVEHCDWLPGELCGNTDPLALKRSRCAAGHKAMWHEEWGGLPSEEFLVKLDPLLGGVRERLYSDTFTGDAKAGNLSTKWAEKLDLSEQVVVGVGAFDAHLGAVGGEIKPYYLSKVMGTSTCDLLITPKQEMGDKLVRGICGQVDGSIAPGMIGLEAGQSAFGDIYAWFKKVLLWPLENILGRSETVDPELREALVDEISGQIIPLLSEQAAQLPVTESDVVALDWMNGRRTPDANQLLKGSITGLTLGSNAPAIFKGLVESTAFGSRRIIERFKDEGVRIDGIIALGGVAKKSPFVMQTVANVLDMPILVARSEETCALGSAMAAAVVAGLYSGIEEAQDKMGAGFEKEYVPEPAVAETYNVLYSKYVRLGGFIESELQQ